MKHVIVAVAAASLVTTHAPASDFSKLGEASFARTILLSPTRQEEALCVSLALHQAAKTGEPRMADARHMAAAMRAILIDEIGDERGADELIGVRSGWFNLDDYTVPDDRAWKAQSNVEFAIRCEPLFSAYRTGGVPAFKAALEPSKGLIPLLSLPRCLALHEYVAGIDPNPMMGPKEIAEVQALASKAMAPEDRKALEAATAAEQARISTEKPDANLASAHALACLATYRRSIEESGAAGF
jgi:hypothetical protein